MAHHSKTSSDLRHVMMAFATYIYSGRQLRDDPDRFEDMEGLLKLLAEKVDFTDASTLLNYSDTDYFDTSPPSTIGERSPSGDFEFYPEILQFPIGFSFAVYPDLNGITSMVPILWTRGLHRYEEFDAPYSGHVAFLDGHVEYVQGKPGEPETRLLEIFSQDSEYTKVLRILEHVPSNWEEKGLAPLPVRYAKKQPPGFSTTFGISIILLIPALVAAALVAAIPKPKIRERLWSAFIAFGIVLIATLILIPSVC